MRQPQAAALPEPQRSWPRIVLGCSARLFREGSDLIGSPWVSAIGALPYQGFRKKTYRKIRDRSLLPSIRVDIPTPNHRCRRQGRKRCSLKLLSHPELRNLALNAMRKEATRARENRAFSLWLGRDFASTTSQVPRNHVKYHHGNGETISAKKDQVETGRPKVMRMDVAATRESGNAMAI